MSLDVELSVARSAFAVQAKFTVPAGRTLAIMGPSGAGKSTIVQVIAGIEKLDAGRIELDGALLAAGRHHLPPHRRQVGLLGQEAHLFPHLDAARNIAFGARAGGMSKQDAQQAASRWLERLGLGEVANHKPAALSGGQRQRIALARALAAKPKFLLIDEPFASLDVEAAVDMRQLVREELERSGTGAIVVSHSAADTQALADDLMVIERGKVIAYGEVEQVFAQPASRFVRAVVATLPAQHPTSIKEAIDGS
ncbi:hypothetical protein AUR04nite_17700 [Glutamicibacter uratoxydans]|uniref:ABC transporter domain-containing protein n=1 Tax=Glutamicibacter uratoxydans TaxID=43667 RepID=A0A4Y4DSA2_GLUUR|nr:ATP-binding cassette domain-containing protein [Glutamicibacter uratoxydans]GED06238.1 hypothetical protein AUR04nite_17700 [Glutamicibacter uratoxydans]